MDWIPIDEAKIDGNHYYLVRFKRPLWLYHEYSAGIFDERDKVFFCSILKSNIDIGFVSHVCVIEYPEGEEE